MNCRANLYKRFWCRSKKDDLEITEIIKTVMRRYQEVHPGWELIFLTAPKNDPIERKRILESIIAFEQK